MAKMKLQFDTWDDLAKKVDMLDSDLKTVTEKALKLSHAAVTPKIEAAFKPHSVKFSGETIKSLWTSSTVKWEGLVASVPIGFNISNGGLASVFVMYGTPRMAPDRKVFNAIYGGATKRQISKISQEVFGEAISEAME